MNCPACLIFLITTAATTVVGGTQLCDQHGREALAYANDGPRRPGSNTTPLGGFTPPAAQ